MRVQLVLFLALIGLVLVAARPRAPHGRSKLGTFTHVFNDKLEWIHRHERVGVQDPQPMWFTQKLDHFDPQNAATWQQKYYVNATYYNRGGPIFLYINGEGPMTPKVVLSTQVVEYAKMFGALVLALEHRFYGDSQPFANDPEPLSTANLRFLSSQQALADLAAFRQAMNQVYGEPSTPWVVFGGSYAGAMSSWFRIKYPHLVVGSVASSGPVHAELDFYQYLQVVQNSLNAVGGANCVNAVRSAFATLSQLLSDPASGWARVATDFRLCAPLSNQNDVINFYQDVVGYFQGVVQYNDEIPTALNITDICSMMTNVSDPYAALLTVNAWFLQQQSPPCIDASYADALLQYKNTTVAGGSAVNRQWLYQTCTEFGYFQTTTGSADTQPFGTLSPLAFQVQECQDVFDLPAGNPAIDWTNAVYGSLNPGVRDPAVSYNIVYPNGDIDPWHALGVLQDMPIYETAVWIQGGAHCSDLHVWREGNPMSLLQAQKEISALIATWLMAGGRK